MSNYFDDSGLIMFQCDVCGRKLNSVNYTNGMKFCAKCYQETFGNNTSKFVDLLNTEMYELIISNLEHKLEEKDQRIVELEEFLHNREKWIAELEKQVNLSRTVERGVLKCCKELEDRWQKLKKWIEEQNNPIDNLVISDDETKYLYVSDILDEMQELENGEKK